MNWPQVWLDPEVQSVTQNCLLLTILVLNSIWQSFFFSNDIMDNHRLPPTCGILRETEKQRTFSPQSLFYLPTPKRECWCCMSVFLLPVGWHVLIGQLETHAQATTGCRWKAFSQQEDLTKSSVKVEHFSKFFSRTIFTSLESGIGSVWEWSPVSSRVLWTGWGSSFQIPLYSMVDDDAPLDAAV